LLSSAKTLGVIIAILIVAILVIKRDLLNVFIVIPQGYCYGLSLNFAEKLVIYDCFKRLNLSRSYQGEGCCY